MSTWESGARLFDLSLLWEDPTDAPLDASRIATLGVHSPSIRMWLASLHQAVSDARGGVHRSITERARGWLASEAYAIGSLRWICDQVPGLDAERVRKAATETPRGAVNHRPYMHAGARRTGALSAGVCQRCGSEKSWRASAQKHECLRCLQRRNRDYAAHRYSGIAMRRLQDRRYAAGLSLQAMAQALALPVATLRDYEEGAACAPRALRDQYKRVLAEAARG